MDSEAKPALLPGAWLFARVTNLTFGGGEPTMAIFYQEMVVRRRWLPNNAWGLIYGLARVTPGTNLLAVCTGVGWWIWGIPGAVSVAIVSSAPGAIAAVLFTLGYEELRSNPLAMAAIGGTLACAVGLMGGAVVQLIRPQFKPGGRFRALAIALVSVVISVRWAPSPLYVLAAGAIAGYFWRGSESR